jgi:hypothetical protein
MIEVTREEYIVLPIMAHDGPMSLDSIATEVYGRVYRGQQTGEMIHNDSYKVYDLSTAERVERSWYNAEAEIVVWQGLKIGDRNPGFWHRGELITDEIQIERAAPEPPKILSDLIKKGKLPMGRYLCHVWW